MLSNSLKAICLVYVIKLVNNVDLKVVEEFNDHTQEQVVVRAVFINCQSNDEQNYLESEATRFQREELFKHSALQGCHKKLALTVKMTSEPDKSSGDEYIPIEHVFDGSNNKRARLLDPYILRIRRDSPVQAYKLRRIDTVSGILTKSNEEGSSKFKKSRVQRNLDKLTEPKVWRQHRESAKRHTTAQSKSEENQDSNQCLIQESANLTSNQASLIPVSTILNIPSNEITINEGYSKDHIDQDLREFHRVKREGCTLFNNPASKRDKRHEHNIIVEDITDEYKIPWAAKERFYRKLEHVPYRAVVQDGKPTSSKREDNNNYFKSAQITEPHLLRASHKQKEYHHEASSKTEKTEERLNRNDNPITSTTKLRSKSDNYEEHYTTRRSVDSKKIKNGKKSSFDAPEKSFVLYDIGNPNLWYTVHVQLFEKMSTPEGKTVWNDITKGEVASVSPLQPEWVDQDINVRYKPTEWVTNDEFVLPVSSNLCLLVPLSDEGSAGLNDDVMIDPSNVGRYIVVHKEDIVDIGAKSISKRGENYSDFGSMPDNTNQNDQGQRRVLVRVSRALLTDKEDDLRVTALGSDHFLTLPHRRPHHAQIDLEARADDNQLIRVGSSGSINTLVADNSRRTRSVITIQATNKGLAAARFRVKARDCGPEMASILSEKEDELIAGPTLLPPRHTQRFRLELPAEIPVNVVHCSVALINDDDESVAVRDVAIKKGDRCFCVWHCDCVCLNEDPKLLCREMSETRQVAAGLSPRERTRRARSVCYRDEVTLNLCVVAIGVIIALLLLGLTKACFGLICRCVSQWGLNILIEMPRRLDHYYESALRGRCVVYDDEGWPVHPDTKKRNVRLVPKLMEFMLNLIFFITVPALLLYDGVKHVLLRSPRRQRGCCSVVRDEKKCFSTHDMQGLQRTWRGRRGGLRRWMTPHAQDLSTDIWSEGLTPRKSNNNEIMRPLLQERQRTAGEAASSCVDSEQDDTEYVLTQMQKSKESLAKSQKKFNESGTSSVNARKLSPTDKRQN